MQPPLLLDLPQSRRPYDTGDVAASVDDEHDAHHGQPGLALYASRHSRSGRPRFVGPAPKQTWAQRFRARLHRMFRTETTS